MATAEQVIPNSVDEALAAWDAGKEVQTVEMGGLGLGYEMAIQCLAFELMRAMRDDPVLNQIVHSELGEGERFPPQFGVMLDKLVHKLDAKDETGRRGLGGLSGAQVGAAKNIAINFTRHGFQNAREQVPDRLIFVRKQDPMALYATEQAQS